MATTARRSYLLHRFQTQGFVRNIKDNVVIQKNWFEECEQTKTWRVCVVL